MSVTVSKADGVTVFTLTTDPDSSCPPLCQMLGKLCYSPVCCSVSQHLRRVQRASQTVLGTLQIMVGLLNIGLGAIIVCSPGGFWQIDYNGFPFWIGGFFALFGIVSILSERYPSPCLVVVNVVLNLVGVAFAITAVVLYSISVAEAYVWESCDEDGYWYYSHTTPSPSSEDQAIRERCWEGRRLVLVLLRSLCVVLIVLSVLELCVTISSVVLGIKSLKSKEKGPNKPADDPELYSPLLEDVPTKPSV